MVDLNPLDPRPLYSQVAAAIRYQIVNDQGLRPGQRVPAARELAQMFGVNENTALRSLRLLRSEGLLDFRRGKPITVTESMPPFALAILEQVRDKLDEAVRAGLSREILATVLDEVVGSADWDA